MTERALVSRRGFLATASVLAASAAALGMHGCGPKTGETETSLDKLSQVDGRWSWSVAPDPVPDNQIAQTIECDILICGYGSAGVPAATYATLSGANTVVMTAGSVPEAVGQECAVFNSPLDNESNVVYKPGYWKKRLVMEGLGAIDMPSTGTIFDRSGDALNWFAQTMNDVMPFNVSAERQSDGVNDSSHDKSENSETSHLSYFWMDPNEEDATNARYAGFPLLLQAADERCRKAGCQVLFSTPLQQLVQDESGAVIGAIGRNADDEYVKVLAKKGVLLATGDFNQDDEMLECFCPDMAGDIFSRNPYGNATGGGHKAAFWAGAALASAGSYKLGLCPPHDHESGNQFPPSRWSNIPFLRVNINGERYTCEELAKHSTYGTAPICLSDARQPGHTAYQILDSKYRTSGLIDDVEKFDDYLDKGIILSGNTIEELAQAAGIDAEGLAATVKRYNELCASGSDDDCGVSEEFLAKTAITDAPFFCMVRPVYKQNVAGGLSTDIYQRVYDTNQHVIPGLYAAGLIRNGAAGHFYPRSGFTGTSKMYAMAGGMICVKHMLGTWDDTFTSEL